MKVEYKGQPHIKILQEVYRKALDTLNKGNLELLLIDVDKTEKAHIKTVIDNFERGRGVLTVLITSFVHKLHNPDQDIRLHQDNMKGGYSGRGIDTKNITPKELKSAFLFLFDQIQSYNKTAETYLLILLAKLIEHREQKTIDLAKPTNLTISTIINYLKGHFESSYSSRGASRLPTLAIYAIYQCLIKELKRFEGKILVPLEEHTSADKSSGRVGDIEVRDKENRVFEAVEIKHGISINVQLIKDAYEKFKSTPIQRYYLLTTSEKYISDEENISKEIAGILNIHGCQVIVNGIYPSLKYYLRLLGNPYEFINNYVENLRNDTALKYE